MVLALISAAQSGSRSLENPFKLFMPLPLSPINDPSVTAVGAQGQIVLMLSTKDPTAYHEEVLKSVATRSCATIRPLIMHSPCQAILEALATVSFPTSTRTIQPGALSPK